MALAGEKRQNLLAALDGLSAEELSSASRIVHELRKAKAAERQKLVAALGGFQVGQRVEFHSLRRGTVQGVVTGIGPVNVLVDAGVNGQWRVSAAVLQPWDPDRMDDLVAPPPGLAEER